MDISISLAWIGLAYILGAIPFGLVFSYMLGKGDLRKIGSGNIGATNALRTGSKWLALLTLLGDALKGTIAVALTHIYISPELVPWAAAATVVGHIYPVWLLFKGGKGVATFLGVLLAWDWVCAIIALGLWLIVALISRYSSLAALISTGAVVPFLWMRHGPLSGGVLLLITLLIWFKHHHNIRRLYHGVEPKIGRKANAETA